MKLKKVNQIEMTTREKRCYELIVKMEKEFGWDILIKIKNATFIGEEEGQNWENPYFNSDYTKKQAPKEEE